MKDNNKQKERETDVQSGDGHDQMPGAQGGGEQAEAGGVQTETEKH